MKIKNFVEISQLGFVDTSAASYTQTKITINQSESIGNMSGTSNSTAGEGQVPGNREIDQALVERAQRGDQKAFGMLVEKYQRKLGRLLSRMIRDQAEVEDVVQESFIKAYRALPNFRGDSAFYTWL